MFPSDSLSNLCQLGYSTGDRRVPGFAADHPCGGVKRCVSCASCMLTDVFVISN